ncbi:MAG: efflux RND transporter periplasmic adaptor subunit, partial [Bacillota bacterium]
EQTLQMARAQLREAEAAVQMVRRRLEDTVIRAPSDGQIAYVLVDPGDMVSPGMAVAGLVDIDPVYVDAAVSERVIGHLDRGDVIGVDVAATSETFRGTLEQVAPAADPQTGMFPVRVTVDNPECKLKPGMLAELLLITERVEGVLAVPRRAVMTVGAEHQVFVVVDGRAERRRVQTGLESDEYVQITEGLSEGERVVESGADFLEDGTLVDVIEGR